MCVSHLYNTYTVYIYSIIYILLYIYILYTIYTNKKTRLPCDLHPPNTNYRELPGWLARGRLVFLANLWIRLD